jgi:hypothetical protein
VHLALSRGNNGLGAVAFDFYTVQEPHEHLQKDPLVFTSGIDRLWFERFVEWVPRNLGKRARVWTFDSRDFYILDDYMKVKVTRLPWDLTQECDIKSLIWAAQNVHGSKFKVPDVTNAGLDLENPLHVAARHATLLQASMRALMTLAR